MKMMRIMVKRVISLLVGVEIVIFASYFISGVAFANIQVAFLSAFFVIVGASYAYKKMVGAKIERGEYEEQRDLLDTIEDRYELYDESEINDAPAEELNLKEIVKEEKAKIKTFSLSSMKHGTKGSLSPYRLVPYVLLILGFIALENNHILSLWYYLPSLFVGIVVGAMVAKEFNLK